MPSLRDHVRKRRFTRTPEPQGRARSTKPKARGGAPRAKKHRLYVIQKHRATALHYDLRLESAGVLRSWAVPKGPSLDPSVKRLAMQVEDHPMEYARFEGVIPAGEYGGGTVLVWDIGTWEPDEADDPEAAFRAGRIKLTLDGKKLRGSWALVRTRGRQWLLMKSRDRYASKTDVTVAKPRSALTRRLMAGIARDNGGDVEKAATADP